MRRLYCHFYEPGLCWFRIFGRGLHIKDCTRHGLLFSERTGHQRNVVQLGKWRIRYLPHLALI